LTQFRLLEAVISPWRHRTKFTILAANLDIGEAVLNLALEVRDPLMVGHHLRRRSILRTNRNINNFSNHQISRFRDMLQQHSVLKNLVENRMLPMPIKYCKEKPKNAPMIGNERFIPDERKCRIVRDHRHRGPVRSVNHEVEDREVSPKLEDECKETEE
jgi:hypothetical protein